MENVILVRYSKNLWVSLTELCEFPSPPVKEKKVFFVNLLVQSVIETVGFFGSLNGQCTVMVYTL